MRNFIKRLTATILLMCTLVSFVVPATYADTPAGNVPTVYDFDLGNSTDPVISQYNIVNKLSRVLTFKDGTSTGKTGWKLLEEMYADPDCSLNWKGEYYSTYTGQSQIVTNKTGLYIRSGSEPDYLVLRLDAPKTGAGTYNVSLTSTDARNTIDVYLLDAADYTTPEAAMTADNKIFTGLVTNETHTTAAPVSVDGGEMILVFNTTNVHEDDRHVVSNLTLTPVSVDVPETTTQEEEPAQIVYDLEIYNNDRYKPMIGTRTSFALSRNAEGALEGVYAAGEKSLDILARDYPAVLNWKIEGFDSTMTAANLTLYASDNTGMRIQKPATSSEESGWLALRLDVPAAGTYNVDLVIEGIAHTHDATAYLFPADQAAMDEAAIEAKLTDGNKIGSAKKEIKASTTVTYENVEVSAAGEYVLVLKMAQTTSKTTIWISQITLNPVSGSGEGETTTTPETTTEANTEVTTEATAESTTQATVPGDDTGRLFPDNIYDFEVYNYDRYKPMIGANATYALSKSAAGKLDGVYSAGKISNVILAEDYPRVLNWKVEGIDSSMKYSNLTLYASANTGMRIQKAATDLAIAGWIAFRIDVPQGAMYDLIAITESSWVAHSVYVFPADSATMSETALEEKMIAENLEGNAAATSNHTAEEYYYETYRNVDFTAGGEYIVVFKMGATASKSTIYLSGMALTPSTGEEDPTEPPTEPDVPDLIPGGPVKENIFDMELYRYELFANMAGTDVQYTKGYNGSQTVAQYMDANYPANINWNIEGYAQDGAVLFHGDKGYGMRAEIGANNYIAFRVNISKAANYNVIFRSTYTLYEYNATAYLVPAPESKMTPEQITAAITEDNKLGTYSHTYKIQSAAILDQKVEAAGEYVLILVIGENVSSAKKGRLYLSSIEFQEIGADATKEEKDKVIYDFDLLAKDPDIRQNTLTSWDNDEHTIRVSDRIAQWYQNGELQWMYEGKSETSIAEAVREKYLRFKATEDMLTVEDAWTAFRLRVPGTGTYDVRLTGIEKNVMVVNFYLIPTVTGVTLSNQQIKERMTKENLLIEKARISGEDTFYLGEYTFGTEQECLLVLEFVRGTRLNLVSVEMTKDGLVADGTLPVGKAVPGVVYDFDICDPFEGAFYKEKRYYMADIQNELNARYNSGAQNWKWINASNSLVSADSQGNTIPGGYLRFYREGGMYVYGEQDAWLAFKIKSPGEGDFTVSMNHAICPDSGTIAMYILPADTDVDKLWEATDPANRVGMVTLTNDTGLSGKEDGFTSFVGYYNFEAGKEYILLLEGYAASRYNTARANMNISQIFMEKGIKNYEKPEETKVVNPITTAKDIVRTADMGEGNFACFEMNGMDYYLVQLEGGTILLYNLDTGELEDEQFVRGSRPRHMAVDKDGKVWMANAWKYLVCYDPVNKTIEKTRPYMPSDFKHNGFAHMTFDENGVIYAALNNIGHVVKYDPATKIYTDLGVIRGVTDAVTTLTYKDGYLYIICLQKGEYNCLVKYNIATGKTEAICEFMHLAGDSHAYGIGFLGEDIISVGVNTTDNTCAVTIDINTMELVDLGLPGYVNHCPTEVIDGKQYVICGSYGLYEYDVATGVMTKVPGFTSMTAAGFRSGGQSPGGKSFVTLDGDFCLLSNTSSKVCCPRVINMVTKEYYEWRDLTRDAVGGGSELISMTLGAEGANEVIMGFWNAHYAATYNTQTGTVTNITETAGQTDTIGFYKGILYAGCYSATVLVELERDRNEYIQRFKLDHKITQQKRLFSIEFGDDKVFVGSIPDTNCNGGSLTVYDTITGQWYSERNLIPDQSIIDEAYWNKVVFITSGRAGGSNTQSMGESALILAYDYENREILATLDPRDYIADIPTPVEFVYGLTTDPNADENGRIWAVVADTLFCFTYDKENKTFDVQTVLSFRRTRYNTSGGVGRQQSKLHFIEEKNQLYVVFKDNGTYCITLEDWDAPVGQVKVASKERIMSHKPEDFIIAEDGNMYFGDGGDLMMLPLNVTQEDWDIAQKVDDLINAIGNEITLESEVAIKNARSAYENLSWYYKSLVQKMNVLEEAEVDLLECKIDVWEDKEITADDVSALQELMDTYKPLNDRQKRYVKNYLLLRTSYEQADKLNDQRIAAAMQKKVDALKDIMPIETLEKEPQVVAVRTELDSLTGTQQYLVDTTILKEAEAQVAELRAEFVKQVEALIQAIPAEITLEAEPAIVAAREDVDKLYALERKQISYTKLETAEAKLRNLKNALAKAEEFDARMKAIGIVTLGDEARIAEARQYYNSLNETARSFVTKYGKLQRAEFILSALQSWGIPVIVVADLGIAFAVVWFVPSLHKKVFKDKKKEEEPTEN